MGLTLSLDDAIRLALQQNLQLQSHQDRVVSAKMSVETAKSAFKVQIRPEVSGLFQEGDEDMSQQYGVRLSKKFTFGGELSGRTTTGITDSATDRYQTDVTLTYTYPLLKGRGATATTAELRSAERNIRAQQHALTLAQQQLVISVATAYYGILRDQMLIDVNQRALERAQLLLQATEAKLKVGMASQMDVFRAELQALTAETGVVDAKESLEQTKRQCNLLLGADLGTEFTLSTPLQYEPVELDSDQLVQQALDTRLELYDTYENITEAERRLRIARQNLYPPLDFSVQYTFSGSGNALDESFDLKRQGWGIGVNSSFNVSFAQEQSAYQQAQMAYNAALRALQTTEQDVMLNVLQTITSVRQAQTRVTLQEQSVAQAEKQLELAELRYKKGLSDNLAVIEAEESVIKAKSSYYSAVMQHVLSKMKLQQATGTMKLPL